MTVVIIGVFVAAIVLAVVLARWDANSRASGPSRHVVVYLKNGTKHVFGDPDYVSTRQNGNSVELIEWNGCCSASSDFTFLARFNEYDRVVVETDVLGTFA